MIADIPGLIEGASDGAGLGIRFLKHLERCRVLLHLIDIEPIDGSSPVENAITIVNELEQYSAKLAEKPRWLVFNKVDLLDDETAAQRAQEIAQALGWEGKYYLISAASQQGVKELCWDIMAFLKTQPKEFALADAATDEFMWDDDEPDETEYVVGQADEDDDDDWDDDWSEEDEEGVEVVYKR